MSVVPAKQLRETAFLPGEEVLHQRVRNQVGHLFVIGQIFLRITELQVKRIQKTWRMWKARKVYLEVRKHVAPTDPILLSKWHLDKVSCDAA